MALPLIKFGYGIGPSAGDIAHEDLLPGLLKRDRLVTQYPSLELTAALELGRAYQRTNRDRRQNVDGAEEAFNTARSDLHKAQLDGLRTALIRILESDAPLRERLTWFWTNHFTIAPQSPLIRATTLDYVDTAIRPNLTRSFSDMLKAVIRHPAMLVYLDQFRSVGPGSPLAEKTGRGLNENLARELLELHTMGAGSGYTQADVRAAAELLTGLWVFHKGGFGFRPNAAHPGPETVLGQSYGDDGPARLSDIDGFLEDLAMRPETADHLARKLVVHFMSDTPDPEYVADISSVYQDTGGNLKEVTRALLDHPKSKDTRLNKVKTPFEFIASALLAFGLRAQDLRDASDKDLRALVWRPLSQMGQPFMRANGPDGWPEAQGYWITPQGLARRISWGVRITQRLGARVTDPREFLDQTLGAVAGDKLRFAVSAAETHHDGIALVLASAEFNRR